MTRQVKSRQRVADHGEVFTADREIDAMLDLVKQETERVDSRFLEPACGDGNFVAEILRRKLEAAKKRAIPPKKRKPLPMTRAIDTLIITLHDENNTYSESLLKIAEQYPDYVRII